jgi:hypothetical protein
MAVKYKQNQKMNPTAKTPTAPRPIVNDVAGPTPMPAPNLVDSIPVHNQGQPSPGRHEDSELDKIMQDVGQELHKDLGSNKKRHFWERGHSHKKEASLSAQKPTANASSATPVHQAPAASAAPITQHAPAPAANNRVKPVAQKSAKQPKPPKQHRAPVMVTTLTILVTAALIAAAYHAYK